MVKFVKPNVKLINEKSITKKIEIAGRTCYRSAITEGSDVQFYKNLVKRKHEAVIEFGHIVIESNEQTYNEIRFANFKFLNLTNLNNRYIISGSIRAWRDFIKFGDCSAQLKEFILLKFRVENDLLFFDFKWNYDVDISNTGYDVKIIDKTYLKENERDKHVYYHFLIDCDRADLAEFTRHRIAGFCVESQRYVNYKTGIEFVTPQQFIKNESFKIKIAELIWKRYCKIAASGYKWLLRFGLKPQIARGLLPNSTKTIMNISANLEEFRHIFKLRCDKAAHPNVRYIAKWMEFIIYTKENIK